MRKITFCVFAVCLLSTAAIGQTRTDNLSDIERSVKILQSKQAELNKNLLQLQNVTKKSKNDIQVLTQRNKVLCGSVDSLKQICDSLQQMQEADRTSVNGKLLETNETIASNKSVVDSRTLFGGIAVVVIMLALSGVSFYLFRRVKRGSSSIDEVRKAQDTLQTAQIKMQEESVKLDNKLIELFDKQMTSVKSATTDNTTDHSLALKVADEIVRIEMNLSRMDASIKGYKQLAKAVQRIKDNFNANGYEIVGMLGKQYNAGMKVVANFAPDENLPLGTQIITGIIKPQINYNGQMIQAAQITVSQNI